MLDALYIPAEGFKVFYVTEDFSFTLLLAIYVIFVYPKSVVCRHVFRKIYSKFDFASDILVEFQMGLYQRNRSKVIV